MTQVKLSVIANHPDGFTNFTRTIDWSIPLPVIDDVVRLGDGLGGHPVVGRIFAPEQQLVTLHFDLASTGDRAWHEALEAAGYELAHTQAEMEERAAAMPGR